MKTGETITGPQLTSRNENKLLLITKTVSLSKAANCSPSSKNDSILLILYCDILPANIGMQGMCFHVTLILKISRKLAPGLTSMLAPGLTRLLVPGLTRMLAPGFARMLASGLTRMLAPGLTRMLAPGLIRMLAPGLNRMLAPGPTRILLLSVLACTPPNKKSCVWKCSEKTSAN